MKINLKRKERMGRKSVGELKQFVESGSLSAAAAQFELNRRESK